ncbi:hypothetical protein HII31_09830 [Pseudocercospora fuligena]|uniref:Non-reducing end beta-L-arabinofuranosidase-like GH127 catalytic domain-containing protein n=1 Tax=Pseudocercospora fuligena TaxID=685502 RepID=A0A8H6VFU0_9PEZI|nr:hypothetical protein HII31_09830 [Pseudocercospora fuligena]
MAEPPGVGSLFGLLDTFVTRLYKVPPIWSAPSSLSITHNLTNSSNALVPLVFEPLPLGSIKPNGWLRDQLQLMSDGLAGHEHDFYEYVSNSTWLGGNQDYSGLNEGFPYWFNGLVPLAYALDDARLKDQVHSTVQTVLELQKSDGWLGPETAPTRTIWGRYPFCLGAIQLAEANSTWTQPIVGSLHRFVVLVNSMLKDNYLGYITDDWARVRMQDMMITLQWLYEKYPGEIGDISLETMQYLHNKGHNWEDWYSQDAYFGRGFDKDLDTLPWSLTYLDGPLFPFQHGVNVGQGLKAPAVVRRWNHNDSLVDTAMNGVNWTMQYHGAASGTILADERLVGLAPYSGSELCTAVETMYSLSYLYQALGDNYYADRAELAAFNSLPAAMTPDWWAHQYVTQPNQPFAEILPQSPFYNTNTRGTTFGLEPNYACCTVNHPQGFPKFLSNSYVKVGNSGLAHVLLSPGSVTTNLGHNHVTVNCTTAYPFLDHLSYDVSSQSSFDLYLRVPDWAGSRSTIAVAGGSPSRLSPDAKTGLHKLALSAGTTQIKYFLELPIRTEVRANDTIAVYKGALLYALEITNSNSSARPSNPGGSAPYPGNAPEQSRDWQYHNTSAWNYAIDLATLKYIGPDTQTTNANYQLANPIFAPGAAPGYIEVLGCQIDWPLYLNATPGFPPTGEAKKCISGNHPLRLVPYGSAKTHMADLPVMR